jgi:two-component system, LytTR family, response regulator
MTKILIVDDEADACEILQILIERHIAPEKEVKSCNSPAEAMQLIASYKPSLVMLDIEMPSMNGFDLLNRIGTWDFDVIFTTAYDKYAIKAIRFSALDYLLKPIDVVDLQNAINRHIVRKELRPLQHHELVGNLMHNLKQKDESDFKLALSTMKGFSFFEPRNIIRLEGVGNYTRFFFTDHKPVLVSRIIKDYEEILLEFGFLRVHKSFLVNKKYITHYDKDGLLWLTDGTHISVSRRKKEEVIKELKDWKEKTN